MRAQMVRDPPGSTTMAQLRLALLCAALAPSPTRAGPNDVQRSLVVYADAQQCGSASQAETAARRAAANVRAQVASSAALADSELAYSAAYSTPSHQAAGVRYETLYAVTEPTVGSTSGACANYTVKYTVPFKQTSAGGPTEGALESARTALEGSAIAGPGFGSAAVVVLDGCDVALLHPHVTHCLCNSYHDLERVFITSGLTCARYTAANGVVESAVLGSGTNREVCDICSRTCCHILFPSDPPTSTPTAAPTTAVPTVSPTMVPTTRSPTRSPTVPPTASFPTRMPTLAPTNGTPTGSPTSIPTTSAPTAAPTKSPSTSPTVGRCPLDVDVVFVLDESQPVTAADVDDMKTFVSRFLGFFDWNPDQITGKRGTRVGLVTFSGSAEYNGSAKTHFQLGQTWAPGRRWSQGYTEHYITSMNLTGNPTRGSSHTHTVDNTNKGLEQAICLFDHTFVSRDGRFACQIDRQCGFKLAYTNGVCSANAMQVRVSNTYGGTVFTEGGGINTSHKSYPRDLPLETTAILDQHGARSMHNRIHKTVVVLTNGRPEMAADIDHVTATTAAVDLLRNELDADVHVVTVGSDQASSVAQLALQDMFGIGPGRLRHGHHFSSYPVLGDAGASELAAAVCPRCPADIYLDCPDRVRLSRLGCDEPEAQGCSSTCCATIGPTFSPTPQTVPPTALPTVLPTTSPTPLPTDLPTVRPTGVPTALPTVNPTEMPTAQFCPNELDVTFLIDGSSSNGQMEYIKTLIKQIMTGNEFYYSVDSPVSPRVGAASFASPSADPDYYYPRVEFPHTGDSTGRTPAENSQTLNQLVDGIQHNGGLSFVWPALDMIRPSAAGNPLGWRPAAVGARRVVVLLADGRFTDFGFPFAEQEYYGQNGGYPGYMRRVGDQWATEMRWPPCDGCDGANGSACGGGAHAGCTPLCEYKRALVDDAVEVIGIPLGVFSAESLSKLVDRMPVNGEPMTQPDGLGLLQRAICYPRPAAQFSLSTCETRPPTESPTRAPTTGAPTTSVPTAPPTTDPTPAPTLAPTLAPSPSPTTTPTTTPTNPEPTSSPATSVPSPAPTPAPTLAPSPGPSTSSPTKSPVGCSDLTDSVMSRSTCLMLQAAGDCSAPEIAGFCAFTCAGCDTTPPTHAPTPSPISPTPVPTHAPTTTPTASPTVACTSGTLRDVVIEPAECQRLASASALCADRTVANYCAFSCAGCSYSDGSAEPPGAPGQVTSGDGAGPPPGASSARSCATLQNETAGLRPPEGGWAFRSSNTEVCSASNISGMCWGTDRRFRVSLDDAAEICRTAGARLCSPVELSSNYARGTGCSLDTKPVWASDGTPRIGSGARAVPVSVTRRTFAVRCCADRVAATTLPATSTVGDTATRSDKPCVELIRAHGFVFRNTPQREICATSFDGNCPIPTTHGAARDRCALIGARLCTPAELTGDFTRGTGCGLDGSKRVWSAAHCEAGKFFTTGGSSFSTRGTECAPAEARRNVRCCGDAVSAAAARSSGFVAGSGTPAIAPTTGSGAAEPPVLAPSAVWAAVAAVFATGMGAALLVRRHTGATSGTDLATAETPTSPIRRRGAASSGPPGPAREAWAALSETA